jgi:septal ring factor EnvC (AmiA/AmiB activator)
MSNKARRNSPRGRAAALRTAALAGAALLLGVAATAEAQEPSEAELESLNRQIEQTRAKSRALETEARKLAAEINDLRQELITAAQSAQQREALISALEDQLQGLEADLVERRDALALRHGQLSGTLGALARLSKDPPQAVFLYPGEPTEAVRGAMLLRAAVPALEGRARLLRDDLEALAEVRTDINAKIRELDQADEDLARDRAALEDLIARKRALYERTAAESRDTQQALDKMVRESQSLQELVARLQQAEREAERAAQAARAKPGAPPPDQPAQVAAAPAAALAVRPEGLRAFPDEGSITAPARGDIVRHYGESTGFGFNAKGLFVATRPNAQIVAPFDGKVIFAGPFRDLGRILIIEHDGGYHSVLAGFERVDAVVGQWVLAGEPVGVMPERLPPGAAHSVPVEGARDAARPQLYVELRRGGQPVNPLNWITAGSLKVHG